MNTPTPDGGTSEPTRKSILQAALKDGQYHQPHTSDELTEQNVDTVIRLVRAMESRDVAVRLGHRK